MAYYIGYASIRIRAVAFVAGAIHSNLKQLVLYGGLHTFMNHFHNI